LTAFKQPIDQLDQHILRALVKDAKTPYAEIAKQSGVSAATIHVRVEKMRQSGIIEATQSDVHAVCNHILLYCLGADHSRTGALILQGDCSTRR